MDVVPPRPPRLAQLILRYVLSRKGIAFALGGLVAALLEKALETWVKVRRRQAHLLWRRHVDLSVVQAVVLSTEHLQDLGRIEKRTLFVKPINEVFRNEYIQSRVLEAAQKAAASGDPMMVTQLSLEDKWHVLNTCTNHISSLFAAYHLFFNEARRTKSFYKSAWYCFTLTCSQTQAKGRWFITPFHPVGNGDVGSLRIRILLVNEKELREIASGNVETPSAGMFNGRHEARWMICQRFADLFERQLQRVTGTAGTEQDWGKNLCGRIGIKKKNSGNRLTDMLAPQQAPEYEPEDNAMLRIHIPFPSSSSSGTRSANGESRRLARISDDPDQDEDESRAKDVVLFE